MKHFEKSVSVESFYKINAPLKVCYLRSILAIALDPEGGWPIITSWIVSFFSIITFESSDKKLLDMPFTRALFVTLCSQPSGHQVTGHHTKTTRVQELDHDVTTVPHELTGNEVNMLYRQSKATERYSSHFLSYTRAHTHTDTCS